MSVLSVEASPFLFSLISLGLTPSRLYTMMQFKLHAKGKKSMKESLNESSKQV